MKMIFNEKIMLPGYKWTLNNNNNNNYYYYYYYYYYYWISTMFQHSWTHHWNRDHEDEIQQKNHALSNFSARKEWKPWSSSKFV